MAKILDYFSKKIDTFLDRHKINYKEIKTNSNTFAISNLSNFYKRTLGDDDNILEKIDDLALMHNDPIIFNALEMFVDDSLTFSPITQKRIWPAIKNKKQQKIIEQLFADLNIDEDSWGHMARLAMYGNCPIRIYYKNDDFSGGISSIEIEEDLFRYLPIEVNGVLVKWIDKYTDKYLEPFEIIFGRINIVNKFNIIDNYYSVSFNSNRSRESGELIKNTFRYGTSLFENSRRIWRQLRLLEDNMILTRLNRTPIVRIYKVRTEGMSPKTAGEMLDFYTELITSRDKRLSIDDNLLKENYAQIGFGENIILPVEEKGDIEVDEFGGEAEVGHIVDVEYFEDKFYGSLKIPKELLIGKEDRGLNIGDNSLSRKEIQYARRVKKLQFGGIKMYKTIAFYNLLSLGEDIEYEDVNVLMNVVSSAEDEEFKNALETSIDNVDSFIDLITNIKDFLVDNKIDEKSRTYLLDYLTTRILNSNDFNWKEFFNDMINNLESEDKDDEDFTTEDKLIISKNILSKIKIYSESEKYIKRIPRFEADLNIKYSKRSLKNEDTRMKFILEKYNNLELKNINTILDQVSHFDISIFNLKYENTMIDVNRYKVKNRIIKSNIKESDIIFMENVFDVKHIMKNPQNNSVVLYEIDNKYYCNYSNGCKLFKNYIDHIKNKSIDILQLEDIQKNK